MQKIKTHRPKKSLGQNFLKSNLALNKIIEAGDISRTDIILEIGPGKGALTEKLLEKSDNVIAVEKDKNLFQFLQEKFSKEISEKKLILLEGDILKLETLDKILSDSPRNFSAKKFLCPSSPLLPKVPSKAFCPTLNYKIIANIPYNITGTILKKFLTEESQPSQMVLMVQNEVAKRIVARDGKESILSISVKAYGEPKLILKVPARYFSPAPKVDSAIISIKNISRKLFTSPQPSPYKGEGGYINESKFWEIIHAGFAHKRKKLSGNLKRVLKNIPEEYKDKRAEDLTLGDWISIMKN